VKDTGQFGGRPENNINKTTSHSTNRGRGFCIGIRQGEEAYGVWRLSTGRGRTAEVHPVKVKGNLITNDAEIAVSWALEGHGILTRAEWDIDRYLRSGRRVQVLPQHHTPDADIHAVYPQRHQRSARVRAFVDLLTTAFAQKPGSGRV
jgi:DNA-binding transcriptional LysR family regulator